MTCQNLFHKALPSFLSLSFVKLHLIAQSDFPFTRTREEWDLDATTKNWKCILL